MSSLLAPLPTEVGILQRQLLLAKLGARLRTQLLADGAVVSLLLAMLGTLLAGGCRWVLPDPCAGLLVLECGAFGPLWFWRTELSDQIKALQLAFEGI